MKVTLPSSTAVQQILTRARLLKQHEKLKTMSRSEREEAGDRIVFECKDPSCVLANKVVWAADPGVWQKRQGHVRRCKAADNKKRTTATSMRATPRS